jgi:cell division protein ZapA (FtsZ GTPase activity inhibitor)
MTGLRASDNDELAEENADDDDGDDDGAITDSDLDEKPAFGSDSDEDLPLTQLAKRTRLVVEESKMASVASLDDGKMHQLQDFAGTLRKVIIMCALNLTPEKLSEVTGVNIDLASDWKKIAHRLWTLQCVYLQENLRESNFDISVAARDLDDPRIATDLWKEIR